MHACNSNRQEFAFDVWFFLKALITLWDETVVLSQQSGISVSCMHMDIATQIKYFSEHVEYEYTY